MAKQKSGKSHKEQVGAMTKGCKLVRFRAATDDEVHDGLQQALKRGAGRIAQRSVSPNQVEGEAEFAKKSNAAEFEAWLQKKRKGWLVDDLEGNQ